MISQLKSAHFPHMEDPTALIAVLRDLGGAVQPALFIAAPDGGTRLLPGAVVFVAASQRAGLDLYFRTHPEDATTKNSTITWVCWVPNTIMPGWIDLG